MNKTEARALIRKYNKGLASKEETRLLEHWFMHESELHQDHIEEEEYLQLSRDMWQNIQLARSGKKTRVLWPRIAVAASIMLCIGIGFFFYQQHQAPVADQTIVQDLEPGKIGATLTLSNGKRILLTDANDGILISRSGIQVEKTAEGKLVYSGTRNQDTGSLAMNTLTTERSEQYQVVLSDGSKVWLNSASSLRFPESFASSAERKVELTGEAYFEIAKSGKKFKVVTGEKVVEVLGTHFNVNAYSNEPAYNVTLLEGKVRVMNGKESVVIKPGEQAKVRPGTAGILVNYNIEAQAAKAWKDGTFKFADSDLKNIMRQLERWYDVEVDESIIPDIQFNGTLSRNVKLSEILAMIELTSNLHFKVEGRRIIRK